MGIANHYIFCSQHCVCIEAYTGNMGLELRKAFAFTLIFVSVDVCWCVLMYVDVCFDVCRCVLMCVDVCCCVCTVYLTGFLFLRDCDVCM